MRNTSSLSRLTKRVLRAILLDLWFERRFGRQCRGEAYYFRFADDFLACFQYREDAERFLREMKARLEQFHLEIEPSKTKLLSFGGLWNERRNVAARNQRRSTFWASRIIAGRAVTVTSK